MQPRQLSESDQISEHRGREPQLCAVLLISFSSESLVTDKNTLYNKPKSKNSGRIVPKGLFLFQTVHYTINSPRIPAEFNGCRIAHLSDLHGALYGPDNRLLLNRIDEARPHLIAMTGDMADEKDRAVPGFIDLCRRLVKRYPVYYITGNHEQSLSADVLSGLLSELRKMGIRILENNWTTISRKGAFLKLYGLVTPMVYYKDPLGEYIKGIHFSAEDTKNALGSFDNSCYTVLLSHNPLYYPSYRDWGADLTLSGHIHGGIIRIPGLGGLLSPDLSLFPKYDGGLFEEEGKHLVVSRGLGNNFLVRVFNPPELVIIALQHS